MSGISGSASSVFASKRSPRHGSSAGDGALGDACAILVGLAALMFILPLMVVVAALIKLDSRGPVFYVQRRAGRHGVVFACFKFRTMHTDATEVLGRLLAADADARREWELTRKLTRDPRITNIGRFLRTSSLDELPQIFNVVTRSMNFVGPRPILEDEAPLYGRSLRHYQSVLPGITGAWQVGGRSNTSYARRVAYDRHYAQHRSFALDCWILVRTVPAVCLARGAR
jgi:exopolysaccharide production protein ExoY